MAGANGGGGGYSGGGSGGGSGSGGGGSFGGGFGNGGMRRKNGVGSWYDFATQSPVDPRMLVQAIAFEDQSGILQPGQFTRSTTWLQNVSWVNPPLVVTSRAVMVPNATAVAPADYNALEIVDQWNAQRAMTALTNQYPLSVEKIMFLIAGRRFANNIYLDWTGGDTASDIEFSFRDNSLTSGDFTSGAQGTIPVFQFATSTFGGVTRNLQVTVLRRGRFPVCLRIKDTSGNWSMYEMLWIVK